MTLSSGARLGTYEIVALLGAGGMVCNLDTGEPLWLGRELKKETLDEFFAGELSARQRRG